MFYKVILLQVHCILKKDVFYYFSYKCDTLKFSSVAHTIFKNVLLSVEEHVTLGHTDFTTEKSLESSKKASRRSSLISLAFFSPSANTAH